MVAGIAGQKGEPAGAVDGEIIVIAHLDAAGKSWVGRLLHELTRSRSLSHR